MSARRRNRNEETAIKLYGKYVDNVIDLCTEGEVVNFNPYTVEVIADAELRSAYNRVNDSYNHKNSRTHMFIMKDGVIVQGMHEITRLRAEEPVEGLTFLAINIKTDELTNYVKINYPSSTYYANWIGTYRYINTKKVEDILFYMGLCQEFINLQEVEHKFINVPIVIGDIEALGDKIEEHRSTKVYMD